MNARFRLAGVPAVPCVLALALLGTPQPSPGQQPAPGRNVNVLGGPTWVTTNPFDIVGDPWRTQSVEPECDVSSRNPAVVVCSAVDYRLVDVPGGFFTPLDASGSAPPHPDSWNMIAQSRDTGLTWTSRPHPGHPLDESGQAAILASYEFGADPMIRFGAAGAMLHVGLVANRGANALGMIYSSTWIHLNNHEYDPEPVKFTGLATGIATGIAGQFRDRPHLAMGEPNGRTCSFDVPVRHEDGSTTTVHQDVPCTTAYVAYATFVGAGKNVRSKVHFAKTLNLGKGWTQPIVLSEQVSTIAQGVQVVKVPGSRRVIVLWRRGAALNQTDAIMMATSDNDGDTFGKAIQVNGGIYPFDQGTSPYRFRLKTMPNAAAGPGRAYVVWADRRDAAGNPHPQGEGRVVLVATDGTAKGTSKPLMVESSRTDNVPRACSQPGANPDGVCWGHQIFPSIAVAAGRIHVAWTDFRNDASGIFDPQGIDEQATYIAQGNRHTADLFAAEAPVPAAPALPAFGPPFQVSQYMRGRVRQEDGSLGDVQQLQWNVKVARNFNTMTVPFDGDYNVSRGESIVPVDPLGSPGLWGFNTGASNLPPRLPVFHDAWTDGRNMELDPSEDYAGARPYVPPNLADIGTINTDGFSLYDGTQVRPPCAAGPSGTKNLDIYTARTTQGLYAFAPWNNKTMGYQLYDPADPTKFGEQLVLRAFPVVVENGDPAAPKTVTLTIANPVLPGGFASFDQFDPDAFTVTIENVPPRSMVARTVYAKSSSPRAAIRVDVAEVTAEGVGLRTTVFLNPDETAPDNLLQPGQVDPAFDVTRYEVHDAIIEGVVVQDINYQEMPGQSGEPSDYENSPWESPGWKSPGWKSPGWKSPGWKSPGWKSPGWKSPGYQMPGWKSPGWKSLSWESPGWKSEAWETPGWKSAGFGDDAASSRYVVAKVTSPGCGTEDTATVCTNTSTAYDANVTVSGADADLEYQLIVYKLYATPAPAGCDHRLVGNTQVLVNIPDYQPAGVTPNSAAAIAGPSSDAPADPPPVPGPDPRATFALGPDETAYVVLVAVAPYKEGEDRAVFQDAWLPAGNVTFTVAPQPVDTEEYLEYVTACPGPDCPPEPPSPTPATSLIEILTTSLPDSTLGFAYDASLHAQGGLPPYTWSLAPGSTPLPPGMSVDPGGAVLGTPTAAGLFTFTVRVEDAQVPPASATRDLAISVLEACATTMSPYVVDGPAPGIGYPLLVRNADLGGDAWPDLVVLNEGYFTTMRGSGTGAFQAYFATPMGATGVERGMAVADFDGNGAADVAVSFGGSNAIGVALLAVGGGPYVPPTVVSLPNAPGAIVAGRLNGDAAIDLAVLEPEVSGIRVLLGDGAGGFTPSGTTPAIGMADLKDLSTADLNGDGSTDLVFSDGNYPRIGVLLGDGTGGFAAASYYLLSGPSGGVGPAPVPIAVGDVNGDGHQDVAVGNPNWSRVHVLLGDGLGALSDTASAAVTFMPWSVAIGDFDSDGVGDVAAVNLPSANLLTIVYGSTTPAFALGGARTFEPGVDPLSVVAGDFNLDGEDDLAVANGSTGETFSTIAVLMNTCAPRKADLGVALTDSPDPAAVGAPVTHTATVTNAGPFAAGSVTFEAWFEGFGDVEVQSVTSSQGSCTGGLPMASCDLGPMPAGGTGTVTLVFTASSSGAVRAVVRSSDVDPDPTDSSARESTTIDLAILTAALPDAAVGVPYDQALAAQGGVEPYSWSLASGTMPTGMTLSANGRIWGTFGGRIDPLILWVKVRDSGSPFQADVRSVTIAMPAVSQTYVVTNTADSGTGSLRQALLFANANAPATDHVLFNIPGTGPFTISPTSALPQLTDSVIVDGTSQPGGGGAHLIELAGTSAGPSTAGLVIGAGTATIRGLVVNRFASDGIRVTGGIGHVVAGNYIGTDVSGILDLGNGGSGVSVWQPAAAVNIGGPAAADRNVVSGNAGTGVFLGASGNIVRGNYVGTNAAGTGAIPNGVHGVAAYNGSTANNLIQDNLVSGNTMSGIAIELGAHDNLVRGNMVGTDLSGTVAVPNGTGIFVCYGTTTNNIIGGTTPAERNVTSGNAGAGIYVCAPGNRVIGNYVGTGVAGLTAWGGGQLPNGFGLVAGDSYGGANTVVGGLAAGEANVIAYNLADGVIVGGAGSDSLLYGNTIVENGGAGVVVQPYGTEVPVGVHLLNNTISANGGRGIVLSGGANNAQAAPVIADAWMIGGDLHVQGTLHSTSGRVFTIQMFANAVCDASGAGEGEVFIQNIGVVSNDSGDALFSVTFTPVTPVSAGTVLTAAAIDETTHDTSEFSACFVIPAAGSVRGTVVDLTNEIVPGVTVTVVHDSSGVAYDQVSGADGVFVYTSLPAGSYTMTAPVSRTFTLSSGETLDLGNVGPYVP